MDWLRKLDNKLFSPPHTFQTILAFVAVRLSLCFDAETDSATEGASELPVDSPEPPPLRRPL